MGKTPVDPTNQVFRWVRESLRQLGLDRERFGTPEWNPLGQTVRPGMTVFIKPNTVSHAHLRGENVFSMITHGSVVRPLLDYVRIALQGQGRIILGDSQYLFGDFDKAMAVTGMGALVSWYRSQTPIPIECLDLRRLKAVRTWAGGNWGREAVPEDERGYRWVDLGRRSHFEGLDPATLRIAVASPREMAKRHGPGRHEYQFPQVVLDCDAIVSVPKLKTHRRAAVSLTLKGFFGLVSHKDSLPHYRTGSPAEGGDEYIHPSFRKRLYSRLHDQVQSRPLVLQKAVAAALRNAVWKTQAIWPLPDKVTEAMWYGNDTIWRTILDIYLAVFFADRQGKLCETPQRNHFCLIDGIIGGQGNGPVEPDPVTPGVLVAGLNPAAIDAVAATLMGFDVGRIPTVREALRQRLPEYEHILEVVEDGQALNLPALAAGDTLGYEPHPEWIGRVELAAVPSSQDQREDE
ncbi:MAG: DUF362 domain-containing protein [Pirellulales bacterium]